MSLPREIDGLIQSVENVYQKTMFVVLLLPALALALALSPWALVQLVFNITLIKMTALAAHPHSQRVSDQKNPVVNVCLLWHQFDSFVLDK